MSNRTILWLDDASFSAAMITGKWQPVFPYDFEAKKPATVQQRLDGVKVWSTSAIMRAGYDGAFSPVEVRTVSPEPPTYRSTPEEIARFMAGGRA